MDPIVTVIKKAVKDYVKESGSTFTGKIIMTLDSGRITLTNTNETEKG